jgi:thiol-disulfide isomerase/thioredoxin
LVTPPLASAADAVSLQPITWKQYEEALGKLRGQIVVVDVWAEYCTPCKKEFPHLVALHKKYGRDGVTCVSVTVDELPQREAALKFLKSKGATFANYLLNEEVDFWQKKFSVNGPPAVFVFDRDGKLAGRFDCSDPDKPYDYDDVESLVKKVLKKGK